MSEIKDLEQAFFILEHGSSEGLQKYLKAVDMIKEQCVHVVRCRECANETCSKIHKDRPNWFCADGERKDGEHEL